MAHILLIEDEAGIRDAFRSFLELKGHEVGTADSAAAARAYLQDDDGAGPDVIVSDERLGDGEGHALLAAAPRWQASRWILYTATPTLEIESLVKDRGACLLQKPVRPAQLLEALEGRMRSVEPRSEGRECSDAPREEDPLLRAGLSTDEIDRCRLALNELPAATLLQVRREGMRLRLELSVKGRIDPPKSRILLALGADCWHIRTGVHALTLELPWANTVCTSSTVLLDLSACGTWPIARLVPELERAMRDGLVVLNLSSAQRLGLELIGRTDLIPAATPIRASEDTRQMLWASEPQEGFHG